MKATLKSVVPESIRHRLRRWQRATRLRTMPLRRVRRFGDLRRLTPIDRESGIDRGVPVDVWDIERFLERHAVDIRGRVLELPDDHYARRFWSGSAGLRDTSGSELGATEFSSGNLPAMAECLDCIVSIHALAMVHDVRQAIREYFRFLKPGGILLATAPGVCHPMTSRGIARNGGYWRFTPLALRLLAEEVFPPDAIELGATGNVLAAIACLHGLSANELRSAELDHADARYPVTISLRAVRPETGVGPTRPG